jgi:HSP20 family protein
MAAESKSTDPMKTPTMIRFQSRGWQINSRSFTWSPPTDVFETSTKLIVKIEIAGMSQSDILINFEDDHLIVNGIRKESVERRAFQQMEIRFGEFSAMVALPKGLDLESAEAEYEDGFLIISIPFGKATHIKIKG